MTLTANKPIACTGGDPSARLPLAASVIAFVGSILVEESDGYVNRLSTSNAGAPFAGISIEQVEAGQHPVSGAADGDLRAQAQVGIFVARLPITGVARDDVFHRRHVFATDEQTFSVSDTSGTLIGRIIGLESSGVALVLCATAGHEGALLDHGAIAGVRTLAATGDEALTTADLGKLILVPNTGAKTLTLPLAADAAGRGLTVKKTAAAAEAVTIDGNGAETVDGAANNAEIDAANDTVTLVSDGTSWHITAKMIAA